MEDKKTINIKANIDRELFYKFKNKMCLEFIKNKDKNPTMKEMLESVMNEKIRN